MPAHPARRAVELAATSAQRLEEADALRAGTAETLLVAQDAVARSRALLAELDRGLPWTGRRGGVGAPDPEGQRSDAAR